jgi:hypothetical protein
MFAFMGSPPYGGHDDIYVGPLHFELIPLLFLGVMALLIAWILWFGDKMPGFVYYAKGFVILLILVFAGWMAYHHLE